MIDDDGEWLLMIDAYKIIQITMGFTNNIKFWFEKRLSFHLHLAIYWIPNKKPIISVYMNVKRNIEKATKTNNEIIKMK